MRSVSFAIASLVACSGLACDRPTTGAATAPSESVPRLVTTTGATALVPQYADRATLITSKYGSMSVSFALSGAAHVPRTSSMGSDVFRRAYHGADIEYRVRAEAVSYTHLTLPPSDLV